MATVEVCPHCDGTSKVEWFCSVCKGDGFIEEDTDDERGYDDYEDDDYPTCGCPFCRCSNYTTAGETCNDCLAGAHQG